MEVLAKIVVIALFVMPWLILWYLGIGWFIRHLSFHGGIMNWIWVTRPSIEHGPSPFDVAWREFAGYRAANAVRLEREDARRERDGWRYDPAIGGWHR